MSIYLVNLISNDYSLNQKLTPLERTIFKEYALFTGDDGTRGYPSLSTLSKRTGYSRRHIIRVVQSLVRKGFLIKVNDFDRHKHRATEYRINLDMIAQVDHKLSTKVVHKPVDKSVDNLVTVNLSSDTKTFSGSDMPSHESSLRSVNNDHDYDAVKMNEKERGLIEQMVSIKFDKQDAIRWLDKLGYDKISNELELMRKQKGIINPGGYLRVMMRNSFERGDSDMSRQRPMKDNYPIPTERETKLAISKVYPQADKMTDEIAREAIDAMKNLFGDVRLNEKEKVEDMRH
jgi:hypothetical protein